MKLHCSAPEASFLARLAMNQNQQMLIAEVASDSAVAVVVVARASAFADAALDLSFHILIARYFAAHEVSVLVRLALNRNQQMQTVEVVSGSAAVVGASALAESAQIQSLQKRIACCFVAEETVQSSCYCFLSLQDFRFFAVAWSCCWGLLGMAVDFAVEVGWSPRPHQN